MSTAGGGVGSGVGLGVTGAVRGDVLDRLLTVASCG